MGSRGRDRVRPHRQGGASGGAGTVREVAGPRSPGECSIHLIRLCVLVQIYHFNIKLYAFLLFK